MSQTVEVKFRTYDYEVMPCVNVKANYGAAYWDYERIMDHYKCSEDIAKRASEWAWDAACRDFWEYWQDTTGELENGIYGSTEYAYFPGRVVKIECQGRSGGWLAVRGLPEADERLYENDDDEVGTPAWTPELFEQWAKFENDVHKDVEYHCSWEYAMELIDGNDWCPSIEQVAAQHEADERAELARLIVKYYGEDYGVTRVRWESVSG